MTFRGWEVPLPFLWCCLYYFQAIQEAGLDLLQPDAEVKVEEVDIKLIPTVPGIAEAYLLDTKEVRVNISSVSLFKMELVYGFSCGDVLEVVQQLLFLAQSYLHNVSTWFVIVFSGSLLYAEWRIMRWRIWFRTLFQVCRSNRRGRKEAVRKWWTV